MSYYDNGSPVPPEGSPSYIPPEQRGVYDTVNGKATWTAPSDAADVQDASNAKKKRARKEKKNKKGASGKKSSGGFFKGLLGGVVGAVIVLAVCAGLWSYTDVFDSFKTSEGGGSSSGGTITIDNTEDTTVAEAVAAKCNDAVVTIYVYSDSSSWSELFGSSGDTGSSTEPDALGSGVIIDEEDGYAYILTNYHVVEDINRAVVNVGDDQYEAEAVGSDSKTDLAVIRIQAEGLSTIEWGDSDSVDVGDWVMAIGSPYGYENTCTTGIVSALYRSDVLSDSSGLGTTVYTDMIQTDAAINPGNSGGALVNAEGQLVGINTYISSTSESSAGLGFAIPSNDAKEVAEQLMEGETVSHAFLGITMQDASDGSGVQVTAVYANTAAAEAGLQTGDVITAIDGEAITSSTEVSVAVSSKAAGDEIEITYTRDGTENTVTATLGSDSSSTEEYAEGGEPMTDSNSGDGSGNEYYYYDDGSGNGDGSDEYYYDFGMGDMLDELFGNSGDSDSGSGSGSGDSSDGGSFWNQ